MAGAISIRSGRPSRSAAWIFPMMRLCLPEAPVIATGCLPSNS